MRAPCRACPFRVGSPVGYDADAMEALESNIEDPNCHGAVGVDAIFSRPPTDKTRCTGYDLWAADAAGYQKPSLAK